MKGFRACVMAGVPGLLAKPLRRRVHLCLAFDEKTAFAGAPRLVDSLSASGPPLDLPVSSPSFKLARGCGAVGAAGRVPFATEAGVFQAAGIAAILCGPGEVAQAHQPEEWIALSEIVARLAFRDRLGDRLAAA